MTGAVGDLLGLPPRNSRSDKMTIVRVMFVLWLTFICGCDSNSETLSLVGLGAVTLGPRECESGFSLDIANDSCEPVLPAVPCREGTMVQLGRTDCVPVGWTSCPQGFKPYSPGWGCVGELPLEPCVGATKQTLGSTTCLPVGDCSVPFPPETATVFVDDSFTSAQLDGTHFQTIGNALKNAEGGSVIAIEHGTYAESLLIERPVTLIGRCPAAVKLAGPGTGPGILLSETSNVSIQGMTVSGFSWGAVAHNNSQLTLEQMVFDGNKNTGIHVEESTMHLSNSVVRGTQPFQEQFGIGISVEMSEVDISDSEIASNTEVGIVVGDARGHLKMVRSSVHDTRPGRSGIARLIHAERGGRVEIEKCDISNGRGTLVLIRGGSLKMTDTAVRQSPSQAQFQGNTGGGVASGITINMQSIAAFQRVGVFQIQGVGISVESAKATVEDSNVMDSTLPPVGLGLGLQAIDGQLAVRRSAFLGNVGVGVHLVSSTNVEINDSLFSDTLSSSQTDGRGLNAEYSDFVMQGSTSENNSGTGFLVAGGRATISDCVVVNTQPAFGFSGGDGMAFHSGAQVILDSSYIKDSPEVGLAIFESDVKVLHSVIRNGNLTAFGRYGDGIITVGDSLLEIVDTSVHSSKGGGLICSGGSARVHGGSFVGNEVALSIQDGSQLAVSAAPSPVARDQWVVVSEGTLFKSNTVKVSAGALPLPEPAALIR